MSVRSRQVSHREFDLTVGELPPILDDGHVSTSRKLIDDFTCFTAGRVNRQLEYLWLLRARYPLC
jgi:hypothetical protein